MEAFWLRVVLSFSLGGLAVALFTTAAERLGSRVGGLLLSFPVKVTIALVLIGLNEGVDVASEAAGATPLGLGVNLVFLAATALFVRRLDPWPALAAAIAVWLAVGLLAILLVPARAPWVALAWILPATVALLVVPRAPGVRPRRREGDTFGVPGLLARAAGAGTIVALSVVLARYGGPVFGGLAAVFPSGWITTMVILTRHHGPDFTAATVRVMVAGSLAPVAFGLAVWRLYPTLGVLGGTLASMAIALVASLCVAVFLRLRA